MFLIGQGHLVDVNAILLLYNRIIGYEKFDKKNGRIYIKILHLGGGPIFGPKKYLKYIAHALSVHPSYFESGPKLHILTI